MQKFVKVFDGICTCIEKFLFYFVSVLIVAISTLVSAEIISRNIFNHSFVIVEELSMIMLAWIAAYSCAYTLRKRGHVVVDGIFAKFSKKGRLILYTITYVGCMIFMIYIVASSFKFAKLQMKIPMTLSRIPRGWIYWGLPTGGCFTIFFFITDLIETLIFKRERSILTSMEVTLAQVEEEKNALAMEKKHKEAEA